MVAYVLATITDMVSKQSDVFLVGNVARSDIHRGDEKQLKQFLLDCMEYLEFSPGRGATAFV